MTERHVRVCAIHGRQLEVREERLWCRAVRGRAPHWCVSWEVVDRRQMRAVAAATPDEVEVIDRKVNVAKHNDEPMKKAGHPSMRYVERWKGQDGAGRVLWIRLVDAARKRGDRFLLRWELQDEKTTTGCWATAPDEQAGRKEFTAAVARTKAAGWKEAEIVFGTLRLELRPIPAPLAKRRSAA